jgi:hypothetical protein
MAKPIKGALGTDPRGAKPIRLSPGVYRDPRTGKTFKSATGAFSRDPQVNKKKPLTPGAPSPGSSPTPTAPVSPVEPNNGMNFTTQIDKDTQGAMGNLIGQVGNMQPFQPTLDAMPQMPTQDYSAMRQAAEQNAMQSFERNMGPQFQREESEFRQRMAEQGVPETSESYRQQYNDMKNAQGSARQNAMSQAFQLGQGEQAQAYGQQAQNYQLGLSGRDQQFNQGIQQYRLPMEQLNAMSPVYGQMSQNQQFGQRMNFDQQQAELDRQHQEQMAMQGYKYDRNLMKLQSRLNPRGGGGGGGGGTQANPFDRGFDAMIMQQFANQGQQQQQQYPGFGGGFSGGLGQGITNGTILGLGMKGGS